MEFRYLKIYAFTDASHKQSDSAISGNLILLGSSRSGHCVPLYWKSKTIARVCHSAKAAETRSMSKVLEISRFLAQQLQTLLLVSHIPIKIYTDSKPLLESVGSTSQVADVSLRNSIYEFKESLRDGSVESYSWLAGDEDMPADVFTKECRWSEQLEMIVLWNEFRYASNEDNVVKFVEGEIKIGNLVNKRGK